MDLIPADHWSHVTSKENPADCASRGIFPSELLHHDLWWQGPAWLKLASSDWPKSDTLSRDTQHGDAELRTVTCNLVVIRQPLISVERFSSFNLYKRVTSWIMRFIRNCKARVKKTPISLGPLSTQELSLAANHLYAVIQEAHFSSELEAIRRNSRVPTSSKIRSLDPMIDQHGILRVGGRQQKSHFSYNSKHPINTY